MSPDAGSLRHRVRIEKRDYVPDSNGDPTQDPLTGEVPQVWTLVKEVWAAIEPVSAREFIQSQAVQSQITARIVIRFLDGLDASMRIVHVRKNRPNVIYNPAAFLADKGSGLDYLTIPCSTGVIED